MNFDVLVVGGGHAGSEAAAAAVRSGAQVALVTMDASAIGVMSCNPAIGGVGKGHLVREIDALDGLMARAADASAIHYRMLNRSKGKAVHGPRIQADRVAYRASIQAMLSRLEGISIIPGSVSDLVLFNGVCTGVLLANGQTVAARSVVLTTGTFLGGILYRGTEKVSGGRVGEGSAIALAERLRAMSLPMGRLKTGTPPRIDGRTIDWSALAHQPSDSAHWTMSHMGQRTLPQQFCGITRTNILTHSIIREALPDSPLTAGTIQSLGPRYCPSIEDKVTRFGDRDGHQIFLEPEGVSDALVYPNGISTSLPVEVQTMLVRSIDGLGNATIVQAGYAVEYDHIDPCALSATLELKACRNLFLAGQINGTTGYEEAAAQGLVAGANAAAAALDKANLTLDRATSYIGVMIDDLTSQGVSEPYRMLTARAEHRLALRADNAPTRLTTLGRQAGLVGDARWAQFCEHQEFRDRLRDAMTDRQHERARQGALASDDFGVEISERKDWQQATIEEVIEDARYAPYVARQRADHDARLAAFAIPIDSELDYRLISGLSAEMCERLRRARPASIGDAERIAGITPAALSALLVHSRASRRTPA